MTDWPGGPGRRVWSPFTGGIKTRTKKFLKRALTNKPYVITIFIFVIMVTL